MCVWHMLFMKSGAFHVTKDHLQGMAEWLRRSLAESKVPGSNLTWEKFRKKFRLKKKKKKRPAIFCLHDGSPDDGSAPQLVKRLGCVLSCLYD